MRLIDGEKLFKYLGDVPWTEFKKHKVLRAVYNAPTIDAEPVVRCGECKWSKPYSDKQLKCNALGLGGLKFPDDFCSYGERREP